MPEPAATALPPSMRVFERGWVSSNNIVFLGRDDAAIVDTGYVRHAGQTLALLRHALAGRPLARIVNTHAHSDHIGGNAALKRAFPGVHITIPAGEAEVVRDWDEDALHLRPMGQQCERFEFDATIDAGAVLALGDLEWRTIASPGHDMASLMLWCETEGILISADALWGNGFGVIFAALPPATSPEAAFSAQRATLETIAALDARLVIPGHGAPFADVAAALDRARGRLASFEQDPHRNTRNAMKVGLSFLLMIEGRIELASLGARLAGLSMSANINRALFRMSDAEFAAMAALELEKSGVARREGESLVAVRR